MLPGQPDVRQHHGESTGIPFRQYIADLGDGYSSVMLQVEDLPFNSNFDLSNRKVSALGDPDAGSHGRTRHFDFNGHQAFDGVYVRSVDNGPYVYLARVVRDTARGHDYVVLILTSGPAGEDESVLGQIHGQVDGSLHLV